VNDAGTAESREDEHVSVPRHDFANTSIHNYATDHDESFDESGGHGKMVETHHADETRLTVTPVPAPNPEKTVLQDLVPVEIMPMELSPPVLVLFMYPSGPSTEGLEWLLTHLAPPTVRGEMNAYDNNTALERAWFSIARGAMAQTDALLRFEALYDAHLALKERCEDVRGEHAGCAEKLINAERERDELRAVNADQVSQIKELEAELARKDSALVFSDRVHEYKESLSIPFNLAIQAGWAKGLAVKQSKEDLMDVLREISGLPRRTVQELLKMYPAPPPQDAPTKVNPSSQAPDSSKSVPTEANV
ncbi:hypothetical protein Tco_1189084, partial [Tanacetum coccineum]